MSSILMTISRPALVRGWQCIAAEPDGRHHGAAPKASTSTAEMAIEPAAHDTRLQHVVDLVLMTVHGPSAPRGTVGASNSTSTSTM